MGVGDGGGADLKVALGRCELLGDRGFLGIDEGDVVLRLQHIEIRLRHTLDQILLGHLELHLGDARLVLGLFVLHPVLLAEDGLHGVDAEAIGIVFRVAAGQRRIDVVVAHIAVCTHLRQQACSALRGFFLPGLQGGPGGGVLGVIGQGVAVNVGQVGRMSGGNQGQAQGKYERFDVHDDPVVFSNAAWPGRLRLPRRQRRPRG